MVMVIDLRPTAHQQDADISGLHSASTPKVKHYCNMLVKISIYVLLYYGNMKCLYTR